MGKIKRGWVHFKDAVSTSRSPSRRPISTSALLQAAGSSIQVATPHIPDTPPCPLAEPMNQLSIAVLPDPEPSGSPNPDMGPIGLGLPTEGRSTRGLAPVGLKTLVEMLKDSVSSVGPLKEAFGGLYVFVEIFEQEAEAQEDYKSLEEQLILILKDLSGYLGSSTRITVTPIIESIAASIKQEVDFIQQKTHRTRVKRIVEATKDAEEVLDCYRRLQTHLTRLTLNVNMDMWKKIDEQTMKQRLKELSSAPTAMYRSTESDNLRRGGCTPNTRVDVMDQLRHWANDATSEKVYWLNGMAGTGKTTIAYTLCDQLQRDHQLGASFFCSRQLPECRNVNRIVPSISYQLALFSLPFRYALSEVLEQKDDIQDQPLEDQFEHLIAVPLQGVAHTFTANVVIVIDALDECDAMNGVDRVLRGLLSSASGLAVKFFVTSRPEPKIVDQMRSPAGKGSRSELRLHDLDRAVVEQDITTYLKDKLPRDKVSEADIERLALRSGVLFIYASTVVRYIEYDNFSRSTRRLRLVLEASATTPSDSDKDIDTLYNSILEAALDDDALGELEKAEMREILYHVVCAKEPLTVAVIADLLDLDDAILVRAALRPLLSVLNLSETIGLVTTLHQSFPNYLLSKDRSGKFYCDANQHHAAMTMRCFALIKAPSPPFNICKLESSYKLDEGVPDLGGRVNAAVSQALAYACRYWGAHLELADDSGDLVNALYEFLSTRLLLWMEVMNLKKCIQEGAEALSKIQTWCKAKNCSDEVRLLAQDAYRFVTMVSTSPIVRSTPHIYISALPFWPKASPVARCYLQKLSGLVGAPETKTSRQILVHRATLKAHTRAHCIAYSPDGKHIASGLDDGSVCIWDARTGERVGQSPKGYGQIITSVAYTPDGMHIVSGSQDKSIRIWGAETKIAIGEPLRGHSGQITSVTCSSDNVHIASGSCDCTVRIWNKDTGQMVGQPLEGHTDGVSSVVYSPDGASIVSGSHDHTICIWNVQTGQVAGRLTGHTNLVLAVAYSPDGAYIVSGSSDKTLRVWDARTGLSVGQPLKGHTGEIGSVQYSPDGSHIVSGSWDKTVCIWDANSHHMVGEPLDSHTGAVRSISSSPDGLRIASCSDDYTIRIWDADVNKLGALPPDLGDISSTKLDVDSPAYMDFIAGLSGGAVAGYCDCIGLELGRSAHTDSANSISYSPDGAYFASGSDDGNVRIWDARTGNMVKKPLEGHTDAVCSVSYSPDGAYIVSGSADGTIRVWDAHSGNTVGRPLNGYTGKVHSVSYSPDGTCIVSGSSGGAYIWDAPTGGQTGELHMTGWAYCSSVSYSADGARIVSASSDGAIYIWDAETKVAVQSLSNNCLQSALSVSYSPCSRYVASGCSDTMIRVWDASTGQRIGQPLKGHTDDVSSASYSPDGDYIASGSHDGTVRVWDARTGQTVCQPLSRPRTKVKCITFSPDGTSIAAAYGDGDIRVWHIHTRQRVTAWAGSSSNQPQVIKPCLCCVCSLASGWSHWELDEDGWVVNEYAERLIWVPEDLRESLMYPHNAIAISSHGGFQLDFGGAKLGQDWQQCYGD